MSPLTVVVDTRIHTHTHAIRTLPWLGISPQLPGHRSGSIRHATHVVLLRHATRGSIGILGRGL